MSFPIPVLELLVSTAVGGGPTHVFDLVSRLPRDEFVPIVVAPPDGPFFDRFSRAGIETRPAALNLLRPGPLLRLLRLIRSRGVRLIHSHGKGAGVYGRLAGRLAGVPAIHTFHGIHYERYSRAGRAFYLALERSLSGFTHTVINVSEAQEAEGLRLGLFNPAQSVVIVNGIDVAELDQTVARAPIERRDLGLAADDLVLGCVARFDPVKGLDVLLRAVSALVPRYRQLKLVLVGDGPEAAKLRRLSETLGLSGRVVFTGVVEGAPRIFPVWHVYVSPSRKEGLPLALLEAMACELPVVATRIPGHLDTVVAGETGLLAELDDPQDLSAIIARLLDDPDLRKRMGRAGRKRVEEHFTVERMASQIARLYREAVARR
jgi:glycosyltransferase involved in cell wall biosynthesis